MLDRHEFHMEWQSVLLFVVLVTLLPFAMGFINIQTQLQAILLNMLMSTVLFLIAILFLQRENIPWSAIGMDKGAWRMSLILFTGWWAATTLVDLTARWAAGQFGFPMPAMQRLDWTAETGLDVVEAWVFVGFAEELAFRGYLHNKLIAILKSRGRGIALAALLFGLWHIPGSMLLRGRTFFEALPGALFLGLFSLIFLNLAYESTGLLPFLGLFHGWSDFPLLLTMEYPSAIGAVAGYCLFLAAAAAMIWYRRRQRVKASGFAAEPSREKKSVGRSFYNG